MDKISKKTGIIIIIFYLAAFLFFFVYSILTFSGISVIKAPGVNSAQEEMNPAISILKDDPELQTGILYSFKMQWIIKNSIRLFIQNMLAINSTALIFIFSLYFPWNLGKQGIEINFINIIEKVIFLFLVLTLVFTTFTELFLPGILKKQASQLYMSDLAVEYAEQAIEEINKDKNNINYQNVVLFLNAYLKLDPLNTVVKDSLDWAIGNVEIKRDNPETDSDKVNEQNENRAADFILKADGYLNSEDYYSALFYANLAYNLDKTRDDAQRISAKSREGIRSLEPSNSDKAARDYFYLKKKGFDKLENNDPIGAYYIFRNLSQIAEDDGDIEEFLNRSLERISEISFFKDEAEKYKYFHGIKDIVFLEKDNKYINIGKMVLPKKNEALFYNIRVIEFDENMEILKDFSAPYGKYIADSKSIIMQAIDRNNENISYKPVYITGESDPPGDILLQITPSIEELENIGTIKNSLEYMNILQLYNSASAFEKYGFLREPMEILLLHRILKPFSFLIISFFFVSIGWFLRYRRTSTPWLPLITVPFIPFIINFVLSGFEYFQKLFLGYTILKTGFSVSIIILIVSQGILLFFVLVSIAAQKE